MRTSSARRAGTRALAALGAGALGAVAFALPAGAQTPVPVEVNFDFPGPIGTGMDTPNTGAIDVVFGDDFAPGVHDLTATLNVDIGSDEFMFADPDNVCIPNSTGNELVCSVPAADAIEHIEFAYGAYIRAVTGSYDYTLAIGVDGETVDTLTGAIEIHGEAPAPFRPYTYGDFSVEDVESGSTVEVAPEFLQADPLFGDPTAVVVTFTHPEHIPSGTRAIADYDNCMPGRLSTSGDEGVTCIVTDFEDSPGTVFTFATPVAYVIGEDAPGPVAICGCSYELYTIGQQWLDEQFGGVTWDVNSDNLFGLRTVSEPESEFDANTGTIWIGTAERPYDLTVDDLDIEGGQGDRVELTATVANEGPAAAYEFFGGPGSYAVLADLPDGVRLHNLWSDTGNVGELFCIEEGDWDGWATRLPGVDPGELDFACFFPALGAGESFDVDFNVDITDADADDAGRLEVVALEDEGYPGVADAAPANNTADITVNGKGSGQLPTTGASLGLIIGIAVLVIAAGIVLFAVASRRRRLASDETD